MPGTSGARRRAGSADTASITTTHAQAQATGVSSSTMNSRTYPTARSWTSARPDAQSISRSSRRPCHIDSPTATATRVNESASPPHPIATSSIVVTSVPVAGVPRHVGGPLVSEEPRPVGLARDAPADQHHDLAAEPAGLLEVVGHPHELAALVRQADRRALEAPPGLGI